MAPKNSSVTHLIKKPIRGMLFNMATTDNTKINKTNNINKLFSN